MSSPANLALWLDLPLLNIQSIRLAQALMESGYRVHVDGEDHGQLAYLRQFFDFDYVRGKGEAPRLPEVQIIHPQPLTRLGRLERHLIFPHAILERCRRQWPEERPIRFLFTGLVTPPRLRTLKDWSRHSGVRLRPPWLRRLLRGLLPQSATAPADSEVVFRSSTRGREYPAKAWDEEYHQTMSRSQFTLCPRGDYVWTYRFFEAAMCGSIPVVEEDCAAYAGFQFFNMRQSARDLRWDRAVVEHNYQLCRERLTVPRAELDREIARLLQE